MSNNHNEVYALRFATRPECRASEVFYRFDLYGVPDFEIGMDYFFWLIRSRDRLIVVDCAFGEEIAKQRNRIHKTKPTELLARMGVDPAMVDDLVITHMHFDHSGNIDMFPNATVHIARAEYEYWSGPYGHYPAFSWPISHDEVDQLAALERRNRLRLIEDRAEIAPGVDVVCFPGHTPGQLVTNVTTPTGLVVLASDALHYRDEIDEERPFYLFTDLEKMLGSYDALRELSRQPHVDVIPGHDPAVSANYVEVANECFSLTQRRDVPPAT